MQTISRIGNGATKQADTPIRSGVPLIKTPGWGWTPTPVGRAVKSLYIKHAPLKSFLRPELALAYSDAVSRLGRAKADVALAATLENLRAWQGTAYGTVADTTLLSLLGGAGLAGIQGYKKHRDAKRAVSGEEKEAMLGPVERLKLLYPDSPLYMPFLKVPGLTLAMMGIGAYGGAAAGTHLVDKWSDKERKEMLEDEKEKARKEFQRILSNSLVGKEAAFRTALDTVAGLYEKAAQNGTAVETNDTMFKNLGPVGMAALLVWLISSGIGAHVGSKAYFTANSPGRIKADAMKAIIKLRQLAEPVSIKLTPPTGAAAVSPEYKLRPASWDAPSALAARPTNKKPKNEEEEDEAFSLKHASLKRAYQSLLSGARVKEAASPSDKSWLPFDYRDPATSWNPLAAKGNKANEMLRYGMRQANEMRWQFDKMKNDYAQMQPLINVFKGVSGVIGDAGSTLGKGWDALKNWFSSMFQSQGGGVQAGASGVAPSSSVGRTANW